MAIRCVGLLILILGTSLIMYNLTLSIVFLMGKLDFMSGLSECGLHTLCCIICMLHDVSDHYLLSPFRVFALLNRNEGFFVYYVSKRKKKG